MNEKLESFKSILDMKKNIKNMKHSSPHCGFRGILDSESCESCKFLEDNKILKSLNYTSKIYIQEVLIDNIERLKVFNEKMGTTFDKEQAMKKLLESIVKENNILEFLKINGSEKTLGIIYSIENAKTKYYKITDKMKYSLSKDLLSIINYEQIPELFM